MNNTQIDANVVIKHYQQVSAEQAHELVLCKALIEQLQEELEKLKVNIQQDEDEESID